MKTKTLTRAVWILSLVSLFADIASEMLYPIMPVYLRSIGFSIFLIGVLEGVAEAVSGIGKGYFGSLSDRMQVRVPFVRLGYLLSAISKPMMALLTLPYWIFSARTLDRIGKGVRTGARDALLSDEATPETKGAVFGFHRSMDTTGAVIGPLIALAYLYFAPGQYRTLFFVAFIPGIISVGLLYLIKEKKATKPPSAKKYNFLAFIQYWQDSPKAYKKLVAGLLVFTLFNSSDYFLLLRMKSEGLNDMWIIGIYVFYNIVYAALSYPLGRLGDKIGLKNVLMAGILVFGIVYFGMGVNNNLYIFWLLFAIYGVYAAATDGVSKALISNLCEKKDTATAIGTYTAFQSICTMIASALAGWIWMQFGAQYVFIPAAAVSIVVTLYLAGALKSNSIKG